MKATGAMFRIATFILVAVFATFVGAAFAQEAIKVGVAVPLSGPVAWIGEDYLHGATLAVEQINEQGGIDGRELKLFEADNACTPGQATSAYRKLIDLDQVDVILGGACSGPTLAAMPIIDQAGIAQLTATATNPDITKNAGAGGNQWQFRINVDDSIMAEVFAKYIADNVGSITIFAINNDFGRGAAAAYTEQFGNLGVDVVSTEYFEQGQADYRPTLTSVKSKDPEALLLVMEGKDASVFIRQMHELGMEQRVFARGSVVSSEFIEAMGEDVDLGEGIEEASIWALGQDPELDEQYEARWGTPTHAHGAMAYYAVKVLAEALKNTDSLDRAGIRDALAQVDMELPGLGKVSFDDHNQAHPNMTITVLQGGEVTIQDILPTSD